MKCLKRLEFLIDCSCGVQNGNHLLVCEKGGYFHIGHDALVKVDTEIMREAGCKNVVIEQHLNPTKAKGDHLKARTEKEKKVISLEWT